MIGWRGHNLKRRVSDPLEEGEEPSTNKRVRCEERSASLPNGPFSSFAGYSLGSPQLCPQSSSSINGSPTHCQPSYSTPIAVCGNKHAQVQPFGQCSQLAGWGRNVPGNSETSEQTMEASHSVLQTPQSEETRGEYQDFDMTADMQRSNSAPDLRVVIDGQLNPMPSWRRLPVPASTSMAGAIVPFKGPQDVVRDAVIHQLRNTVHGALGEKHKVLGLAPESSGSLGLLATPLGTTPLYTMDEDVAMSEDGSQADTVASMAMDVA